MAGMKMGRYETLGSFASSPMMLTGGYSALRSACFGDSLPQDREVFPPDLVGSLGRQALGQLS
jgi:hypothetical protein